jgi:hypothetical protein
MLRWTAAQILSGFALGKPLKLTEWPSDMDGKILPAQLKLREAIVQGRITDIRGRLGPPGLKERIEELLRDSEFMLLVTSYGTLTVHPPHRRLKFIEKYGIDLDNWWREIDFDQDEGERAVSASLAPCQGQPDRPHLRLVLGVRSGETEAPVARAEEPESELTKAKHTRWQRDRVIAAMKEFYSPHGIRPNGVSIKRLTDRINRLSEFKENQVSEDTVRLADSEIKAPLKK